MNPTMQLKLSQHFALTPQLHQSIKLLQLSTVDLNQEVEKALAENLFLERDEDEGAPVEKTPIAETTPSRPADAAGEDENARADDARFVEVRSTHSRRDDEDYYDFLGTRYPDTPTLQDHLKQQFSLVNLSRRDHQLGCAIVDMLDENGYLLQPLEDMLQWLPPEQDVMLDELCLALRHIQALDPTGVGARSVPECLTLQLDALPQAPGKALARAIVNDHLALLAARDFNQLRKILGCSDADLRAAYQLIKTLNPKPGASFGRNDVRYISPDVIVKKSSKGWTARLNADVVPHVRLNKGYVDAIKNSGSGAQFSMQLQEARWMIKNIQQRLNTILRVSQAIVERQHSFLEHGEIAMRPLVLREIADSLSLHESTISRVTTQKYILTPRGTYELKYFFGSHVATDTGGACSATAIRAMIKQLVGAEDSAHPISDNQISKILGGQGIVVARRTVAKYRESMNIAAVNLRRSF